MADNVLLPTQDFDFTDLWADNVICRYADSNGDTTNYPDRYSYVGVMTGDPWSAATHINVIDNPTSCSAFPDSILPEAPLGATKSVCLGNYYTQCGVEDVEYTIRVDTNLNSILVFQFMPILQESHERGAGAAFSILDEEGQIIDSVCMHFKFSLEGQEIQGHIPGNPEWKKFTYPWLTADRVVEPTRFQYLDWASLGIDLTPYHNQTLIIRVQNFDCAQAQHFGLCYFTFKTQPKRILINACEDGKLQFIAPEGFFYRWYRASDLNTVISTERTIEVFPPYDEEMYYCDLSVNETFVCATRVAAKGTQPHPKAKMDFDIHRGFCADTVYIKNVSEDVDRALWQFDGLEYKGQISTTDYKLLTPFILSQSGDYTIKLKCCLYDWDCLVDSTEQTLHIDRDAPIILYDTICTNTPIVINGQTHFALEGDTTLYYSITDPECGGTLSYELNEHVLPAYLKHEYITCYGKSFEWKGRVIARAGLYPDTIPSIWGCDSVTMLHAVFAQPEVVYEQSTLCRDGGDSCVWRGKVFKTLGEFRDSVFEGDDCVRIYVLTIEEKDCNQNDNWGINPLNPTIPEIICTPTDSTLITTICEGESFAWNDTVYTTQTDTSFVILNAAGCDSVCTLKVNVLPKTCGAEYLTTCETPFVWHGKEAVDGDTIMLKNANACDSIVTLHLTIKENYLETKYDTICQGETYTWRGQNYTNAGEYTITAQGLGYECDSVLTLILTVNIPTVSYDTTYVCYTDLPITWNGQKITAAGSYNYKTTNAAECDSTAYLEVYVSDKPITDNREVAICEGGSYEWYGRTLTIADTYDTTLLNKKGCDSIYAHLDLTVNEKYLETIYDTICQGETYTWRGKDYTTADTYTIIAPGQGEECDSILTLVLHVKDCTPPIPPEPECEKLVGSVAIVDTICAEEDVIILSYTYTAGAPKMLQLNF
ncbi:MAG: hypothetical protein MJZ64_07955, partial [Paludibacteraceae bacterium]|nr:hypothetical protein [Paludibacteraceae bacterium]